MEIKTNDLSALGAVLARRDRANLTEALSAKQAAKTAAYIAGVQAPKLPPLTAPLNTLVERRKREENNNRIKKLASVIKRQDPRLYVEALQKFGLDLEGLSVHKQVEFIAALEKIRKDYRI